MNFFAVLTIVFITLKVIGFITWSWWLVFIPVYINILLLLAFAVIAVFFHRN